MHLYILITLGFLLDKQDIKPEPLEEEPVQESHVPSTNLSSRNDRLSENSLNQPSESAPSFSNKLQMSRIKTNGKDVMDSASAGFSLTNAGIQSQAVSSFDNKSRGEDTVGKPYLVLVSKT